MAILEAFCVRDEWGTSDLASHTGMARSTVHRMLHSMKRAGILADAPNRGEFRLGPSMTRVALLLTERIDVVRVARSILEATVRQTGETAVLALLDPERRQFWAVDAAESDHPFRYVWDSARAWTDLHVGSSGRGILAFLPPADQEAIISKLPDPIPGRNITHDELRAELSEIRSLGYALSRGERFPGAIGVSAPVWDAMHRVIGDVIIAWPDVRSDPDKEKIIAKAVMDAAAQISTAMGHVSTND